MPNRGCHGLTSFAELLDYRDTIGYNPTMSGALEGVVVADFTRVLAGPYATMLLGDMGAKVIKVERPEVGDDTRHWGPPFDEAGRATYFEGVNRNKSSLAIDMSTPEGMAQARELALSADIVINNFPTATMNKFGLDYASLSAENPRLIHCSITGFGSGVGAAMPGYDLLVQAVGGLMSVTGPGPGEPNKVGVALVDVITGLHATIGILAALHSRNEQGVGQAIEVNLLSSLLSAMVNQASAFVSGGVVPGILGNAHPSITPYEVYQTADRALVLAVGNDGQFAKLCGVLGLNDLPQNPKFATNTNRVANRIEVNALLNAALASHGADHWWRELSAVGVPCGPINSISEAFDLATSLELNPIIELEQNGELRKQVANPITFSATPVSYQSAPPAIGEMFDSGDSK
jgi:crotonobetainyl-CoA:carnitine CoA-transferase CaiB-like acyl-CoA transferase